MCPKHFKSALLLFSVFMVSATLLSCFSLNASAEDDGAVPAAVYYDDSPIGGAANNSTSNSTQGVNLYLNGTTTVTPAGNGFVIISPGQLTTAKPAGDKDLSAPCPSMYGKDPRMYYIVGSFATPIYTQISAETLKIELWADGHAKKAQFLLIPSGGQKLLTEEKDVSGPTKFTAEDPAFKTQIKGGGSFSFLIYYKTPLAQLPPSCSIIYGSATHPANAFMKVTNPMNATYSKIAVSGSKATFNVTLVDAFGPYDIASFIVNTHGPQSPQSVRELSKERGKNYLNVSFEAEYKNADGGAYMLYVVCKDNNGNTWEVDGKPNSTFLLATDNSVWFYGVGAGGAVLIVLIAVTIMKARRKKRERETVQHAARNVKAARAKSATRVRAAPSRARRAAR